MSKKTLLVIFSFLLFFNSRMVFASVIINEVMYDPIGSEQSSNGKYRDWIELYNDGTTDLNFDSKWRFSDGSLHLMKKNDSSSFAIPIGTYAILVDDESNFLADYPNFSGFLINSSVNLNSTTGKTLKILDQDGNVISNTVSYSPSINSKNNGNSLQLINNVWTGSTPSPGKINQTSSQNNIPPTDTENSNPTDTTDSVVSTADANTGITSVSSSTTKDVLSATSKSEDSSIKTKIKTKAVSFLDTPLTFEVKSYGIHGEELTSGKYFWNFGDGTTEEKTDNKNLAHTYSYSGEYLVSVEYFANSYSSVPDVLNKIKIKVVPIEFSISRTGDAKDFFIEISNNSNYDIDLSLWKLSSLDKVFSFPRNTSILAKKKIILSSMVTKFVIEDKNNLKLSTSNDKIVYQTISEVSIVEEKLGIGEGQSSPVGTILPVSVIEQVSEIVTEKIDFNGVISSDEKISASDLSATAINSDILPENLTNSFIFPIILFIFLSLSGGAVYFIRRNNVISQAQNDFEILDE